MFPTLSFPTGREKVQGLGSGGTLSTASGGAVGIGCGP